MRFREIKEMKKRIASAEVDADYHKHQMEYYQGVADKIKELMKELQDLKMKEEKRK